MRRRFAVVIVLLVGLVLAGCKRDVTELERQHLEKLQQAVALMDAVISSLPEEGAAPEEQEKEKKPKEESDLKKVAKRAWEQLVLARNEYGAALLADTAGDSEMADLLLDSVKLALKAALISTKDLRRMLKELEPSPVAQLAMLDEVERISEEVLEFLKGGS